MRSARHGNTSVHVDATPEEVWSLLADVSRMGEWSPECYRVSWLDGGAAPAKPGARFKGWNRYGPMRWTMTCEVKTAEPGRELSWSTVQRGKELVRWTYRFEPDGTGTKLTELFDVVWLPPLARLAEDFFMRDRDRRRLDAMRRTLESIRAAAEPS